MSHILRAACLVVTFFCCALAGTIGHAALIGPTLVALTGTAAPAGGNYNSFGAPPTLNASGQVAYAAALSGGASTSGIFTGAPGSVQAVALEGAAAPAGGNYSNFGQPVLNGSGQVAYHASLTGGSSTRGLFVGAPGSVQAVALQGTAAPAGGNYSAFGFNPRLNSSGQVAYFADLTDGSSTSGIFSGAIGSVQAVAVQGAATPAGGNYDAFGSNPTHNASGQVAYFAQLTGGASPSGIFVSAPGSVQAVALEGAAAPAGGNYVSFTTPGLNASGKLAYRATLTGGTSASGIFVGTPGSVQAAALRDLVAPAGGNYTAFSAPVLNSSGQVAFQASLTRGSSTNGIFAGTLGSLQTIALGGTATPDGVGNFSDLGTGVAINALGQVAFTPRLAGTGVTMANDYGLYAGWAGNVVKIVREGDVLDVDPGLGIDLRTVSAMAFTIGSGGQDGRATGFNDDGLLVYQLTFSDGSIGIFTSQIVAVPEPGALALWALGSVGLVLRLPRRSGPRVVAAVAWPKVEGGRVLS